MSPRFVADSMLGRLAKRLRAFGFDVFYEAKLDDHAVIAEARRRGAIALTRDTRFPKPYDVRVLLINSNYVNEQLEQVARELSFDLTEAHALSRCTVCNHMLRPAAREEVWDRIPPYIYLTQEQYAVCSGCGRVYWEGSHASRLKAQLEQLSSGRSQA